MSVSSSTSSTNTQSVESNLAITQSDVDQVVLLGRKVIQFEKNTKTDSFFKKISLLYRNVDEINDEISKLPLKIKDHVFDFKKLYRNTSLEWKLCKVTHDTLKIAQSKRKEAVLRAFFVSTLSIGVALLATTAVISLLAYLNIFHSPFVLLCIVMNGTALTAIGLIGYGITALNRKSNLKATIALNNFILENLDPKGFLKSKPLNEGNYIEYTNADQQRKLLVVETDNTTFPAKSSVSEYDAPAEKNSKGGALILITKISYPVATQITSS